jgi:hypothetical protein
MTLWPNKKQMTLWPNKKQMTLWPNKKQMTLWPNKKRPNNENTPQRTKEWARNNLLNNGVELRFSGRVLGGG